MKEVIAARLAELLADDRGSRTLALLRLMRLFDDTIDVGSVSSSNGGEPQNQHTVGIWDAQSVDGYLHFVRSKTAVDSELWADVEIIPPKRSSKRTVLVGESVARGYLYDPCFNPATALKNFLQSASDGVEMDVVDLARSDLLIDGLQQIIEESIILEPDAIVVFAGNNWSAQTFEVLAPVVGNVLGNGGDLAVVSRLVARQLGEVAERFVEWLGAFSKRVNVPVLVLIPEFNLMDWCPAVFPPAPFLPESRNAQWFSVRDAAVRALSCQDFKLSHKLAAELRALDGGVTMAGVWIEAATKLATSPDADARSLLESLRDAEIWRPLQATPRCFAVIQDALRRKAPAAGLKLLDLAKRFEEYTGGPPDRRLFLDYCHLTSEGINVAMASVAELLLPDLGVPGYRSWRQLASKTPGPSPEVEGEAHLLAAIHCAKLGQPFEFVRYHCAEAVQASPSLVDAIASCLDFQTRRTPNLLCSSFEHLIKSRTPTAARYLLTHGCESKEFQKPLRRAFANAALSVLDTINPQVGQSVRALTVEVHAVTPNGLSLLQQAYSEEGICSESQFADFHRSYEVESHFVLFARKPSPLELRLTCRLPQGDGEISIRMNGVVLDTLGASEEWTTYRLSVPEENTVEGENAVDVRWPIPPTLGEGGLARLRMSLELGSVPAMSPLLGEIHNFTAFEIEH